MGVVNVTPDSFSDGGQFLAPDIAVGHAKRLVEEGADILDIGGESTRPGAEVVDPSDEQDRILPVISAIRAELPNSLISVDTRNASTMAAALKAGADIINDVSALTYDSDALSVVATAQVPVMLMHAQGTPDVMQDNPHYNDTVSEVLRYLKGRKEACLEAGIKPENIILDPGIGFGKRLEDNLALLKHFDRFHELDSPLLIGTSRKSFIEKLCPDTPPQDRFPGSVASMLMAVQAGVDIVRVHDVRETKQALSVWKAINDTL